MALSVHLSRHQVDRVCLITGTDQAHLGEGEPVHVVVHQDGLLGLEQGVGAVPVDVYHCFTR